MVKITIDRQIIIIYIIYSKISKVKNYSVPSSFLLLITKYIIRDINANIAVTIPNLPKLAAIYSKSYVILESFSSDLIVLLFI